MPDASSWSTACRMLLPLMVCPSNADGGTALESWMSLDLLYGVNRTTGGRDSTKGVCPSSPTDPSTAIPENSFAPPAACFNAQLAPLFGQTVRGILWYQVNNACSAFYTALAVACLCTPL